jgi:hypothetical protein
MIGVAATGG